MTTTRIECTAEGFERNWIEVSDAWTQRDIVEHVQAATDDELWALTRRKAVACHIELATGAAIDNPDSITSDNLLDADVLLLNWLGRCLSLAIAQRRLLGNASARPLSNGNGKTTPTTMTAPTLNS